MIKQRNYKAPDTFAKDMGEMKKITPEMLAQLRARLAEATNHLNDVLKDAENALIDLRLGVRAEVSAGPPLDANLVFGKSNNKWCLFWWTKEGKFQALDSSPREWRMRACELLPALHLAMVATMARETDRIEAAIGVADALIDEIEPTPEDSGDPEGES